MEDVPVRTNTNRVKPNLKQIPTNYNSKICRANLPVLKVPTNLPERKDKKI